jgi:hypothetical protein
MVPFAAATFAVSLPAWSQTEPKMTIGADGALVLPLGDWADFAGLGFGALARFEYNVSEQLAATARAGYIVHLEKDDRYRTSELPLLGGIRYAFGRLDDGMYLGAEAGLVNFTLTRPVAAATVGLVGSSSAGYGEKSSDTKLKFGGTVGVGYRSDRIDGRAGLFVVSLGDLEETMGLLVTVGYSFVSF